MSATDDHGPRELVIRPRFGAGPLTLTPVQDVADHVVHLDIDDAGVYLDRAQARDLAAALQRCCAPAGD